MIIISNNIEFLYKNPYILKCNDRNISLFQIPLLTFTYPIPGVFFMEKKYASI